jgi:hypothetical protein
MHKTIRKPAHSRSLKNWRIASIEASRIVSCPLSHLSTVERDTPSSREIRAFFHFDRFANLLKRSRISAFSRSLRSFWVASIVLTLNDALLIKTHEARRKIYAEGRAKWKNMTQPNIVSHNPRNRQRGQTSEYRLVISTIIILKHARFLPNYI